MVAYKLIFPIKYTLKNHLSNNYKTDKDTGYVLCQSFFVGGDIWEKVKKKVSIYV